MCRAFSARTALFGVTWGCGCFAALPQALVFLRFQREERARQREGKGLVQ